VGKGEIGGGANLIVLRREMRFRLFITQVKLGWVEVMRGGPYLQELSYSNVDYYGETTAKTRGVLIWERAEISLPLLSPLQVPLSARTRRGERERTGPDNCGSR